MRIRSAAPLFAALLVVTGGVLLAGPLNPPAGPITGTSKPLSEIEPRIAINATNTPGDATTIYKITQPGSYYLPGNLFGVVGKHGIVIAASDVTIDLRGFSLIGGNGTLGGIYDGGSNHGNAVVRNGTISFWGTAGVDLRNSFNMRLADVLSTNNSGVGFYMGDACTMSDCIARDNNGVNLRTGFNCSLDRCTAVGSVVGSGINLGQDSRATGCVANFNALDGIATGPGCVVDHCSAASNVGRGIFAGTNTTVSACAIQLNGTDGISAGNTCSILDCVSSANGGDGISFTSGCLIRGNTATSHITASPGGHGFDATGGDNRIENNHAAGNRIGFLIEPNSTLNRIEGNGCTSNSVNGFIVNGVRNLIIRNTCSSLTGVPWVIVANNVYGPIIDDSGGIGNPAVNGFSAAGTLNSTAPNANFSY